MTSTSAGSDQEEKGATSPTVQSVQAGAQLDISDAVALKRLVRKTDLLMMPGLCEWSALKMSSFPRDLLSSRSGLLHPYSGPRQPRQCKDGVVRKGPTPSR